MGCECKRQKRTEYQNLKKCIDSSFDDEKASKFYEANKKIKGYKRNDNQKEYDENLQKTFLNKCNDFLKKIKINKDDIKMELLNEKYTLHEDSNVKIQVIGKIGYQYNLKEKIENIKKMNDFVSVLFKDSNPVDDKDLKKEISAISISFKKKGVDLNEDYSLFMKEIGGFIVEGNFSMKYENNKFIYEFILELKNEAAKNHKFLGILSLEILLKKKPYIINFKYKEGAILFSTIFNMLIFLYEDKIGLIIEILEIICKEDKEVKTLSLTGLTEQLNNLKIFNKTSNS